MDLNAENAGLHRRIAADDLARIIQRGGRENNHATNSAPIGQWATELVYGLALLLADISLMTLKYVMRHRLGLSDVDQEGNIIRAKIDGYV